MSNLIRTKNGQVLKRNHLGLGQFPAWNSFIDELFHEEVGNVQNTNYNKGKSSPKVNVTETDESFTLNMAIPGFRKSDFIIDLEEENLTISMEVKKEENEVNFTKKEYDYGSFKRSFILPETVEEDKIEANYTDGILSLIIPKKEEAKPKPARTIEIS